MNQTYNHRELKRYLKTTELSEFRFLTREIDLTYDAIIDKSFEFNLDSNDKYCIVNNLIDKLVLRKLYDVIKKIYKNEQANRRIIISQTITLLSETSPFWVIKSDIKSFYESIDRDKLLKKFKDDAILSYQSMLVMNKLFKNPVIQETEGIPKGINISALLAEIYMRKFDKWISRYKGVYYYARFVDDIIIFVQSENIALQVLSDMNEGIASLADGLKLNKSKTKLYKGENLKQINSKTGKEIKQSTPLEYLGYSFSAKTNGKKNESTINISIASKKVKKIKTRIIKSLLDYSKNRNFELLEKRIVFLTGNYTIKNNSERGNLRSGIYYNYSYVNDYSVLSKLNQFLRKSIYSKSNNFGVKINLSDDNRKKLLKYCFKAGFDKKVYHKFEFNEMKRIIECW